MCSKQYVGQTKRRIVDRFQGHFGKIVYKTLVDTIGFEASSFTEYSCLFDIPVYELVGTIINTTILGRFCDIFGNVWMFWRYWIYIAASEHTRNYTI